MGKNHWQADEYCAKSISFVSYPWISATVRLGARLRIATHLTFAAARRYGEGRDLKGVIVVDLPGKALAQELIQQSRTESRVTPMAAVIEAAREGTLQARKFSPHRATVDPGAAVLLHLRWLGPGTGDW